MNPAVINISILFILVLGACLALTVAKWRQAGILSLVAVFIAGVGMLVLAAQVLLRGPMEFGYAWQIAGFPARFAFKIDYLSAIFLSLIAILSVSSVIYALGFMAVYRNETPKRYYFPFLLFIAGLYGVVTSADFFYFLVFWETMTLFSYFLVVYENRSQSNLNAGFVYFLVTHITSVGLIVAAVILYSRTGSFLFNGLPGLFQQLAISNPNLLHLLLALFFIGFGAKAGVFPFGFWMPNAYAAAPTSATAIFSAVMSKMGVYGLLRIFVWLLPVSNIGVTWGLIIASFGILSMLVGNMRTLGEVDSKRLLAQSSIGQMGYILLGVGVGLFFRISDPYLSMLAFIGALYHLYNHAFFKSLLFFNTGSIFYKTGTNNLNQVGGMVKLMPAACACGLIGSLAIAGIPPLNGFMSKWLLYQSAIFGGIKAPIFAFYGIIAIFISTVSLAAYLKYLGTAYLGILPEKYKNMSKGQPLSMVIVQVLLVTGCILLGLFPGLPVKIFYGVIASSVSKNLLPGAEQVMGSLAWGSNTAVQLNGSFVSAYAPLIILLALLMGVLISVVIYRSNKVNVQTTELWSCGEDVSSDAIRYRAASFYAPFVAHFAFLYRRHEWPKWKLPAVLTTVFDLDSWFYFPVGRGFMQSCKKISNTHEGRPQIYLLWQLIGFGLVFLGLFLIMGVK